MASSPLRVVSTRPRSASSCPRSFPTSCSRALSERSSERSRSVNCFSSSGPSRRVSRVSATHFWVATSIALMLCRSVPSRKASRSMASIRSCIRARRAVTSAGVVGSAPSRARSAARRAWICPSSRRSSWVSSGSRASISAVSRVAWAEARALATAWARVVPSWSEGKASEPRSSSALRMRAAMARLSVTPCLPPSSEPTTRSAWATSSWALAHFTASGGRRAFTSSVRSFLASRLSK